jgi:hypothetical protein
MKIALLFVITACLACRSSDTPKASVSTNPGDGSLNDVAATSDDGPTSGPAADGSASDGNVIGEDFVATLSDFDCNRNSEWTMVGVARYKNTLGHDAEMLAVARSATGGTYPVGTIVQLNPLEAMVKRGQSASMQQATTGNSFYLTAPPTEGRASPSPTAVEARAYRTRAAHVSRVTGPRRRRSISSAATPSKVDQRRRTDACPWPSTHRS